METDIDLHPLKLHICHGKILVWSFEDALIIREKLRIVGSCIGSFSAKPRQNVQLSLPLLLSKIEAKFILNNSNSILVDSSNFPENVDFNHHQQKTEAFRKSQFEIQTKIKQDLKWNELDGFAGKIKKGKLEKQMKKSTSSLQLFETSDEIASIECKQTANYEFDANNFEEFKKGELKKVERYGADQTWIQMPIKSELTLNNIALSESDIQLSEEEKLKFTVFCNIHQQGYYLTDGLKFGGHFLVYPGDPGIYHSVFIVYCIPFDKKLSAIDYATLGRLATSVKKTLLLCSVDKNDFVVHSSFAWSGLI